MTGGAAAGIGVPRKPPTVKLGGRTPPSLLRASVSKFPRAVVDSCATAFLIFFVSSKGVCLPLSTAVEGCPPRKTPQTVSHARYIRKKASSISQSRLFPVIRRAAPSRDHWYASSGRRRQREPFLRTWQRSYAVGAPAPAPFLSREQPPTSYTGWIISRSPSHAPWPFRLPRDRTRRNS
jgi:hypothetical protein